MTEQELFEKVTEIGNKMLERRLHGTHVAAVPHSVKVKQKGNFTIAIINNEHFGVSKRNPTDKENPDVGISVALYRAVEEMVGLK